MSGAVFSECLKRYTSVYVIMGIARFRFFPPVMREIKKMQKSCV